MQLTEISPEKTPEKFYSRFEEDSQSWLETEIFLAIDHVTLRRKALEGWQDLSFYTDRLELHHVLEDESRELIAEGQVYLEYLDWDNDTWSHYSFGDAAISMLDTHTLQAVQSDGDVSLTVTAEWKIGSAKQSYHGVMPGQKIRIGAVVKIINRDKLILDYSDFLGIDLVNDQESEINGETYRFLTFASDGVEDEIEVDPYISIEESGTTITVSTNGDDLVFDDTYSANIDFESPAQVIIKETNLTSTIYPDCMFVYGTGTSDLSGNTYSAINISTNFNWYPLTSDAYGDRTTRTAQYQDTTLALTTGTAVTGLTDPLSIAGGFASDGALHITPDAGDVKFTFDRTRHKPVIALADWPLQSGDPESPTIYSRFFWDCKTSAPSTYDTDDGNTVTLGGAEVTNDGLLVEPGDVCSFPCTDTNNIKFSGGSISFDYKRETGFESYGMFFSDASNISEFSLYAYSHTSNGKLAFYWNGTRVAFVIPTDVFPYQEWMSLAIKFAPSTIPTLWINGISYQGLDWATKTTPEALVVGAPSTTALSIGSGSGYEAAGYYKNFRITDDVIFNYGAYFTGNGAVDTDVAHRDITYYNSDGTSLDIGVTSYTTTSGNITASTGTMAFWFNPSTLSVDTDLMEAGTTFKVSWDDSDNDVVFTYGASTVRTTTTLASGDHWVKVEWDASDIINISIDGMAADTATPGTAPTLDAAMSFDSVVDKIYITDTIGTPEIPTVAGVPLHMPILKVT